MDPTVPVRMEGEGRLGGSHCTSYGLLLNSVFYSPHLGGNLPVTLH